MPGHVKITPPGRRCTTSIDTMEAIARKLSIALYSFAPDSDGSCAMSVHPAPAPLGEPAGCAGEISPVIWPQRPRRLCPRASAQASPGYGGCSRRHVISEAVEVNTIYRHCLGQHPGGDFRSLVPRTIAEIRVVQLNGTLTWHQRHSLCGGILEAFGRAYNARVQHFRCRRFSTPTPGTALARASIQAVLDLQKKPTWRFFGSGHRREGTRTPVTEIIFRRLSGPHRDGADSPRRRGGERYVPLHGSLRGARFRGRRRERASGPNETAIRRVCVWPASVSRPLLAALGSGGRGLRLAVNGVGAGLGFQVEDGSRFSGLGQWASEMAQGWGFTAPQKWPNG